MSIQSAELSVKAQTRNSVTDSVLVVNERIKFFILYAYASFILMSSLFFNSPREIIYGLHGIIFSPGILITDYMAVGNVGAAFFNSGLLMILSILLANCYKVHMNGTIIAAVFTIGGFAFFGKSLYNVWPVIFGVYLYSRFQKDKFHKYILVALFGTALAPMVSQVSFGIGLPLLGGLILGVFLGIGSGFILPPLANHMIKFHQGYNIYNVGFTAGLVGTFMMSIFRSFGIDNTPSLIVVEGYTHILAIYLICLFLSMVIIGFLFNNSSINGYKNILSKSGRLVTDFVTSCGFGISMVNMGIMGLLSTFYILLINGDINGPIIGGIFTIVGFSAFGKHIKNITPILLGVYIASLLQVWDVTATTAMLAALFGTTLAPLAGEFGFKIGIAAGFLHMAVVMNVSNLHGGMNLYNNGFAGGFVAAMLVPLIISLRKVNSNEKL